MNNTIIWHKLEVTVSSREEFMQDTEIDWKLKSHLHKQYDFNI